MGKFSYQAMKDIEAARENANRDYDVKDETAEWEIYQWIAETMAARVLELEAVMTLQRAANYACEFLAEGWTLDLYMERGSGFLALSNVADDPVEIPGYDEPDLERQLKAAVAISHGADPETAYFYV